MEGGGRRASVEIVVPVLNEERALPRSIPILVACVRAQLPGRAVTILIADNGSTDRTPEVAAELAREWDEVRTTRLGARGRGRALRVAWMQSSADILAYMDVDLSADLGALPALIDLVDGGGCAIAIGSRHAPGSEVERSLLRDVVSRGYNRVIKVFFRVPITDAQCGFKAITREAAQALVPFVDDDGWFFDSELLILAAHMDYRIGEVGLRWVEDTDSRVHIVGTAIADLQGLVRLRLGGVQRAARRMRRA